MFTVLHDFADNLTFSSVALKTAHNISSITDRLLNVRLFDPSTCFIFFYSFFAMLIDLIVQFGIRF